MFSYVLEQVSHVTSREKKLFISVTKVRSIDFGRDSSQLDRVIAS